MLTLLLQACPSTPRPDPHYSSTVEDASAKSFAVPAGKSNIYLYRAPLSVGMAIAIAGANVLVVTLDGKVAGRTGHNTFFLWHVDPGAHEIRSISSERTSTLELETMAGKSYYVWQEVTIGMTMGRSRLELVDEETGRKAVAESKRLQPQYE